MISSRTGATGAGRILVVDDDAFLRRMVRIVLEGAGYVVRTATNGREGLQKIADECPDLLTLDVMMPEMSGIEMADLLASDPATRRLPIILLTAVDERSAPELRDQAAASKSNVYVLQKPFHRQQFLDKIGEAMSGPLDICNSMG